MSLQDCDSVPRSAASSGREEGNCDEFLMKMILFIELFSEETHKPVSIEIEYLFVIPQWGNCSINSPTVMDTLFLLLKSRGLVQGSPNPSRAIVHLGFLSYKVDKAFSLDPTFLGESDLAGLWP